MTSPTASATSAPRTRISEKDLNDKIMQMLHGMPACTDARSVMLERTDECGGIGGWRISHFNAGCGDRYTCKVACRRIESSLSEIFEMVG